MNKNLLQKKQYLDWGIVRMKNINNNLKGIFRIRTLKISKSDAISLLILMAIIFNIVLLFNSIIISIF